MEPNRLLDVIGQQLDDGMVGIAIAVVAGDAVRWSGAFGRLDVDRPDPVTTRTVFPVQSVSKSIVATALMQWVERGAVNLDDPVNRHLHPVQIANEWEAASPITIRQLFTHTAGLPMSLGWGASPTLEALVRDEMQTDAQPGTRMIYANWGYDALGYLLSRLADVPWDAAVRDAVLDPLAMTATHARTPAPSPDAPNGHAISQFDGTVMRLNLPEWPFEPGAPSGALMANVEDLSRFLIAHLTASGAGLAPATFADMHRLHAPLGAGGGGMGLGFRVDRRGERPFFCHVGDGGGFTTFVGGHSEARVGVVVLMNVGGAETARSAVVRAALEWALEAVPSRAVPTSTPAARRPSLGRYRSTYWGLGAEVAEADGVLTVAMASSSLGESANVGRLTDIGGRWRAEGGMFNGCELDFDVTEAGARFCGGLYPFEFLADDTPPVALPDRVDETGDLTGVWIGTMDSPVGPVPLRFEVGSDGVRAELIDVADTDTHAEAAGGWVRAQFAFEITGFGVIEMIVRLGLTTSGLEGLIYARHPTGELAIPATLARAVE